MSAANPESADPETEASPPRREGAGRDRGGLTRLFDIIELLSESLPVIRVDDVTARLGYPRTTAYRHVKVLCEVGLLVPVGGAGYALGPRIVELERLMQLTDPLLQAGKRVMPALWEAQPNSIVLLCNLYGDRVLCIHREGPETITGDGRPIPVLRSRGLPLPLFQGAASLAILAFLPPHRLRSIYMEHHWAIDERKLGSTWKEFRARMTELRRHGAVVSTGLITPDLAAVAVPIRLDPGAPVLGSLTRMLGRDALLAADQAALVAELHEGAGRISRALPAG